MNVPAPVLVFGWGNPSRGDDALGPACIQQLRSRFGSGSGVDYLEDFQLQPEHALDLVGRRQVLFVDASREARAPFTLDPVWPASDRSLSSHALSPQALLAVYRQVEGRAPPPCSLLAIRGEHFELGAPLGAQAQAHLAAAVQAACQWLADTLEDRTLRGPAGCGDLS
ncbi:MAG: hydrogenase maturation protease [Burkholderiales bacterium]|nr:hydrogenase maturation protease [Burkholderiales bacterium]